MSNVSLDNDQQFSDLVESSEQHISDEHLFTIKEKITNLHFPGIKIRQLSILGLFVLGYLAPILTLLILFPYVQSTLEQPLSFLHAIGGAHFLTYAILSFSFRCIFEELNFLPNISEIVPSIVNRTVPESFGYSYNIKRNIAYLIDKGYYHLRFIQNFRKFEPNNPTYNIARKGLFYDPIPLQGFDSETKSFKIINLDFINGFIHTLTESQDLIDIQFENMEIDSIINSSEFIDPVVFSFHLADHLSSILLQLLKQ
jgi:hypothetical protein